MLLLFWRSAGTPPAIPSGVPSRRTRRIEVQRRNGEVITVSSEADLELALRQLTPEPVKRKRSRKIGRAVEAAPLPDLAPLEVSAVFAILAEQASQKISEARLFAILADMRMRQEQDEEEAILLLLS